MDTCVCITCYHYHALEEQFLEIEVAQTLLGISELEEVLIMGWKFKISLVTVQILWFRIVLVIGDQSLNFFICLFIELTLLILPKKFLFNLISVSESFKEMLSLNFWWFNVLFFSLLLIRLQGNRWNFTPSTKHWQLQVNSESYQTVGQTWVQNLLVSLLKMFKLLFNTNFSFCFSLINRPQHLFQYIRFPRWCFLGYASSKNLPALSKCNSINSCT